ncbi:MAG TPA: hypothetical protein PK629_09905 [Oscillospiraceae bacterium]|nr:hypothetical protein [Oscillospiraceae bacterium]HPF54920.1 hypothetical protein [Clostridiales bacterium]HPK34979.1 hypothetical protein [Oscillospiraceae bacterium]HPR75537.1 hypothetical protein [Oscillospiraceae bacterium]
MKYQSKTIILFLFCVACVAVLAVFPKQAASGITQGLMLAAGLFIPAMLPMYFLVFFIAETRVEAVFRCILSPLCRFLWVGDGASIVLVSGFLGGYPSGAIAAKKQVERGALSEEEAGRLLFFCINPGPVFVVGAVGGTLLGSVKAGFLLLAAGWSASLLVSIFCRIKGKVNLAKRKQRLYSPLTVAFCDSISNAANASLVACAAIALSCAAVSVLATFFHGGEMILSPLFEVTGGVSTLSKTGSLPLCAAALGFGGISVMIQIAAFGAKFFSAKKLLLSRIIHALLSAGFTAALSAFFPVKLQENAAQTFAAVRENQVPAALLLVFCGFALSLANLMKKRYNREGL